MKVYVLDTGYLETDKNNVVNGATMGTYSNPHVKNEWIKLPVMAVLIDHPDGKILYHCYNISKLCHDSNLIKRQETCYAQY
jgi:hypothetical protein